VVKFRVASTPRYMDRQTNEWKDGESLFLTCNVWRQAAENVAESLQRGMRVIVQGLRNATAKVTKTTRGGGGGQQAEDPWAAAPAPAGQAAPRGGDGWGPPASSDEPPF
jgi:single-strand DNA-binding protein